MQKTAMRSCKAIPIPIRIRFQLPALIPLMMRLMTLFLFTICLQVSARTFSQKITLSGNNLSLKTVFDSIRKQSGYVVFGNRNLLEATHPVSVSVKDMAVEAFLDLITKDQPLQYRISGKTILLSRKALPSHSLAVFVDDAMPTSDLTGKITDDKGVAISGLSVTVKGTGLRTVTADDGSFELKHLPVNAIVVVAGVNIYTLEIAVNGRQYLAITAAIKENKLQVVEIVSTGYQVLPRERSTGSFAKPDMNLVLNRSTSMNILQRLDGLVPGLVINNSPAAAANPVLVRGLTSLNGSRTPLFVVDGVPLEDISSVNPQDVADITVLKDAAAASIWGSRASNGVIVIQTKRGNTDEKLSVEYDGFYSFQGRGDLNYMPVLNSRQFIQGARDIFDPVINPWATVSSFTGIYTASRGVPPHEQILYNRARGLISAQQADASLDSLAAIDNRQQIRDRWYRPASLMNHSISVRGGSKTYGFYGSAAYTSTVSNQPGESNNTFKINVRQDIKLGKTAAVFLVTDLTNQLRTAKRNLAVNNRFYPYQLFNDQSGQSIDMPYMQYLSDSTRMAYTGKSGIDLNYNPVNEFNYGYTRSDALLARITGGIQLALAKGLKFEGTYGLWKGAATRTSYDDAKAYSVRAEVAQYTVPAATTGGTPTWYLPTKGGRYAVTDSSTRNWTVRNQLTYNNSWNNQRHQLSLLAGQEAQELLLTTRSSQVWGYNELLKTYQNINYAKLADTGIVNPVMLNNTGKSLMTNAVPFRDTERRTRFTSYYANAAYTFLRKYTFNASWRIDESNLFGKDKSAQNRPIWSVGGKWLISGESFMRSVSWIDRLALRTTYGITGNSPNPGSAASYDILTPNNQINGVEGTGLLIATPANRALTWERTSTVNMGIDFSVLDSRINASIDLYHKKTENLIGRVNTNVFSGYAQITGNLGDMINKGAELSLNTRNVINTNLEWSTLFTLSYNSNKITRLNLATPITTAAGKIDASYLEGYAAYALFAYRYGGLDKDGNPLVQLNDNTVAKAKNAAGINDVLYMGTVQPVWNGGLSNTLRFKNFTLDINLVYSFGHKMRRDVNSLYTGRGLVHTAGSFTSGNVNAEFANRWKQSGDEAFTNIPAWVPTAALAAQRDVAYYTAGNVNVLNAAYIKMRDITLAWSLPAGILQRVKAKAISFRVQVNNVMLWKANHYGIDPEFHNGIGNITEGGVRAIPFNQNSLTIGAHVSI
ncbi:SusC/RagA family TonB-linked outer membrane protein [Filimonas effusa]|uniref:SusC/RagA family TonB-linked outer membrane protein n=1 Tax=Filimonas effusa TaxID=2508721 RepID=A0A4Q1D4Q2_9BACT|nr:SusC/RagA family TonB-linked outer membrane protein [Filimonas effusa]RXK82916.1 SusC/RagA family TonB-linked outer membrane protein [Filimonas effusa]